MSVRHDQAMGPLHVPSMTGMHSGDEVAAARARLRAAFAELLRKPGGAAALTPQQVTSAISRMHEANVAQFGWRDAEILRAEAMSEAVESTVPQPEVIESDFGCLDIEDLQP